MATKSAEKDGAKKNPFYRMVVADARSRDGRFIEELGYYDPNTNPATIKSMRRKLLSGWPQEPNRLKPPNHY